MVVVVVMMMGTYWPGEESAVFLARLPGWGHAWMVSSTWQLHGKSLLQRVAIFSQYIFKCRAQSTSCRQWQSPQPTHGLPLAAQRRHS